MSPEISYFELRKWEGLAVMKEFLRAPHDGFFSIVDAQKIASLEQIRICYTKALKIVDDSVRIKMPESAFLMLLSGSNQISKAQVEVGISSSTKSVIAVYDSPDELNSLLESCSSCFGKMDEIPVPELDKSRDAEIFSRMARVQLAL